MKNIIDQNVSFSYFLPYGLCSPHALGLSLKMNPISFLDYDPEMSMQKRLAEQHRTADLVSKRIALLIKAGYVEEIKRKHKKAHWAELRFLRLTTSGLYLLSNTPDKNLETKRLDKFHTRKERDYLSLGSNDLESTALRNQIYRVLQSSDYTSAHTLLIDKYLINEILSRNLSILATQPVLAVSTSTSLTRSGSHQVYGALRQSNILALFLANDFLTYLDRRPMNCSMWAIGRYTSADSIVTELEQGTLDIPGLVYATLTSWYAQHPNTFSFLNPEAKLSDLEQDEYLTIPSYYSAQEILSLFAEETEDSDYTMKGQRNLLRHTFSGVAVGSKISYIMYHTHQKTTAWIERVESQTSMLVTKYLQENYPHYNQREYQDIDSCIMVCESRYQFKALFEDSKIFMQKKYKRTQRVGIPYKGYYIVPVNASGAYQIRLLMLSSPAEFEERIIASMVEKSNGKLTYNTDPVYSLLYHFESNGVQKTLPVLVAHTMNFQRLFWAWEDSEDKENKTEFLIACFPGQVSYLKHLFPGYEFL